MLRSAIDIAIPTHNADLKDTLNISETVQDRDTVTIGYYAIY